MNALTTLKTQRLPWGPGVHNRVVLKGTLKTRSPLHVGLGKTRVANQDSGDLACKLMLRDRGEHGTPYIPGTSLRGVLRAWCLHMLGLYGAEVAAEPSDAAGADRALGTGTADPGSAKWEDDQEDAASHLAKVDLVSGLFGSTRAKSRLEIWDARPSGNWDRNTRESVVSRVAIDPHLGTADPGKLFSVEYVRSGAEFPVTLHLRNVTAWELGLVLEALEAFNDRWFPLQVGGLTNHGYGVMKWTLRAERGVGVLGTVPGLKTSDSSSSVLKTWLANRGDHGVQWLDAPATNQVRDDARDALVAAVDEIVAGWRGEG